MIQIISKNVTALKDQPLINLQPFVDLQRRRGQDPYSPHKKTYDSGTSRHVFPGEGSGVAPDTIPKEPDERGSMSDVSSGYDRGLNPGGRANDGVQPGGGEGLLDGEQNYLDSKYVEISSRSPDDTATNLFMREQSDKLDQPVQRNLGRVYAKPPVARRWNWQYSGN